MRRNQYIKYCDWTPCGTKLLVNSHDSSPIIWNQSKLTEGEDSALILSNRLSISSVFKKIGNKFEQIYEKRAFAHHFLGEGMAGYEFGEAREHLRVMVRDLYEAGKLTEVEEVE